MKNGPDSLFKEVRVFRVGVLLLVAHTGGHAATRFLEGSLKEVLLRRVLRRRLVRVAVETGVFRKVLRRGRSHRRRLEGA